MKKIAEINQEKSFHSYNTYSPSLVAIVPAAGLGRRMGAHRPKQYLSIDNQTILEHTVHHLLAHQAISNVVIALHADDPYFSSTSLACHENVMTVVGGGERADSVLAALKATNAKWVLVHDAARPCVCHQDIDALIDAAYSHQDGAILASRVTDTIKRAAVDGKIQGTVCRDTLWHALTPQMFQREMLLNALQKAIDKTMTVTDEASAIELAGGQPILVAGHSNNIKITTKQDLDLARFYLSLRKNNQHVENSE